MTKDELKKMIKEKFRTLSNFSRISGIDRTYLQIVFSNGTRPTSDELQSIKSRHDELEPRETGNLIDQDKLEILKSKLAEYGGTYKLCKDHPKRFLENQVYPIIRGERKRNSKAVKALFKFFEIK